VRHLFVADDLPFAGDTHHYARAVGIPQAELDIPFFDNAGIDLIMEQGQSLNFLEWCLHMLLSLLNILEVIFKYISAKQCKSPPAQKSPGTLRIIFSAWQWFCNRHSGLWREKNRDGNERRSHPCLHSSLASLDQAEKARNYLETFFLTALTVELTFLETFFSMALAFFTVFFTSFFSVLTAFFTAFLTAFFTVFFVTIIPPCIVVIFEMLQNIISYPWQSQ
jgi:hypothetical protein